MIDDLGSGGPALSDHERRRLADISAQLTADDPGLARALRRGELRRHLGSVMAMCAPLCVVGGPVLLLGLILVGRSAALCAVLITAAGGWVAWRASRG